MLQLLGASKGSEVPADKSEGGQLPSESRKQCSDGIELACGRLYAKNCDKT
jgi:hypothetical protein